jgi:hypothetical protein
VKSVVDVDHSRSGSGPPPRMATQINQSVYKPEQSPCNSGFHSCLSEVTLARIIRYRLRNSDLQLPQSHASLISLCEAITSIASTNEVPALAFRRLPWLRSCWWVGSVN